MKLKLERFTAVIFSSLVLLVYVVGFGKPVLHSVLATFATIIGVVMPHCIVSDLKKEESWRD